MHFNIVANAKRCLYKDDLLQLAKASNIIALDGAANTLIKYNIIPTIVLGDFDSISNSTIEKLKKFKVASMIISEQYNSDLGKAINYALSHNAVSINIYNAIGGNRLDHTILNIRLLKRFYNPNIDIVLFDKLQKLIFLKNITFGVTGRKNNNVSLMAFNHAIVSSQGLKYDMSRYNLKLAYQESTSNSLSKGTAKISITGNCLVVLARNCSIIK